MIYQHIILGLLWIFYCVLHSLLAAISLKSFLEKRLGKNYQYYRLSYSIFAAITLLLLLYYQFSINSPKLIHSLLIKYIAAVVLVTPGLIIMLISIFKYFRLLSGVKPLLGEKQTPELKIDGIHKYVRHPLYTGTLLFIWGAFFIFPFLNNLISVILITVYVLIGIRYEEEKLLMEFGESYKYYRLNVPMLIPRLNQNLSNKKR